MNDRRFASSAALLLAGSALLISGSTTHAADAPATLASIAHNWTVTGTSTRVNELTVSRISPPSATVEVACAGHGCPFKTRSFKPKAARAVIGPAFRGRVLKAGGHVDVVVVAPGTVGRFVSFAIRNGKLPAVTAACASAGSISPIGCPGPSGPAGPLGPAGQQGAKGDLGPSNGYFVTRGGRTFITGTAAAPTSVAELSILPAGNYLAFARATAANISGPSDAVRCMLRANGSPGPTSSIAVGTSAGFAGYGDISAMAPIASTQQFNLDFACFHDQAAQTPYLESIELSAIAVGSLDARQ